MESYQEAVKDLGLELFVESGKGSLQVLCKVVDIRKVYGRKQWKVAPLNGRGEAWVEARLQ